jgi:molybdate transport system ATP-binding protein
VSKRERDIKPEQGIHIQLGTALGDFHLDIDLKIPGHGVTALFGHSGCGKTTLLRCIAGLQATTGKLTVNGDIWQDAGHCIATHKRPLAYVFQEASLFPHLSVKHNLEYGYKRIPPAARKIHLNDVVDWLGLGQLIGRHPGKLSGGERQRVAIARALLTSPRLLLMDEPLSALDQQSKNDILPYLEQLRDTLSTPIIYVTHSIHEVARLAHHLVVMESGKVLANGPLTDTLARLDLPIHQKENAGVVIEATIKKRDKQWHLALVEFPGGHLWVRDPGKQTGYRLRVRIMARDVSIALERQEQTSILNLLPAEVTEIVPDGHPAARLVKLKIGNTPILSRITARSETALRLTAGKQIWAQIKSVAVLE